MTRRVRFLFLGLLWKLWRLTARDNVIAGSWAGNETIWRMTLDLNHILYYYDADNDRWSDQPVRNVLTIVDGIIAGQGDGPLSPDPIRAGVIVGGFNPSAVDAVIGTLIGYNLSRIPTVHNARFDTRSRFNVARNGSLTIIENNGTGPVARELGELAPMGFEPQRYWRRALRGDSRAKSYIR